MAIVAAVRRSLNSIENYGGNVKVFLHASEHPRTDAIIQTTRGYLIIYSVTLSEHQVEARYHFDTTRSGTSHHRRRSFAGAGETEPIPSYSVKYKRMIRVDSGIAL